MKNQERFKKQCDNKANPNHLTYELSTDELQQVAGGMKSPVRVVITSIKLKMLGDVKIPGFDW